MRNKHNDQSQHHHSWIRLMLLISGLFAAGFAMGQGLPNSENSSPAAEKTAMVVVDGKELFPLRGVSAYPAKQRAQAVRHKIIEFARDSSLSVDDLTITITRDSDIIKSSKETIVQIFDADAELENVNRDILAQIILREIKVAAQEFRNDRTPQVLLKNAGYAALVTLVCALLLWADIRLFRWLDVWTTRHVQRNINKLANKSHQLISGGQVWGIFAGLLRFLKVVTIILLVYFLLNTVLGLFPWTRPFALALFALVLNPVESLAKGLVEAIPDISFLIILFFVVRYLLKIVKLFFTRVQNGYIKLENFDNDWAMPTFKILRILIVAFAVVIAYPYIPGSDSMAFKGISVFLGVIFSLGSSSFISGMIAGLTMTYRGAFKEGDRVQIGDVVGVVTDIKLMITRIRTPKNEVVVIPNSNILNTNVVNFSTMARKKELILHTIVGIGYDTPWRQVEALLLLAAEKTEGLIKEPKAFVLQRLLGDYAVNYELNVYCADDSRIPALYSALHANIQDVFNEHSVQIMSPSYEADPDSAKIVPKDQWYAAPARSPTTQED